MTPQQIEQFDRDGFVIVDRILSPEQVELGREAMARIYAGTISRDRRPAEFQKPIQQWGPDRVKHYVHARFLDAAFWDIATSARPAQIAAELLQTPSVSLTEDQLLEKPAGGRPLAMHQDYSYWAFSDVPRMATCWIALNNVTPDMGPMRFIKGSHRWPLAPTPSNFAGGDDDQIMEVADKVKPPGAKVELVDVIVPAGGGSFHHAMTLHGSTGNRSQTTRHAISLHYAAADCRCTGPRQCWEPYVWEGIEKGDRIANAWMPVTWPAIK
ncbi:MAG: phytanoyl-CoA dioxygenase family protein [Planctomycetota bacterium]|nr:phytanoyl-CoA dioxygenase family protein [Planctomycetota bacterium]